MCTYMNIIAAVTTVFIYSFFFPFYLFRRAVLLCARLTTGTRRRTPRAQNAGRVVPAAVKTGPRETTPRRKRQR